MDKQAYKALLEAAHEAQAAGDTERLDYLMGQIDLAEAGPLTAVWEAAKKGTAETGRGLRELVTGETPPEPEAPGYALMRENNPMAVGVGEYAPAIGASVGAGILTGGAGLVPSILAQAGVGGLMGYVQPGTQGERVVRGLTEAGTAGLGEGVGQGITNTLGRMMKPRMAPASPAVQDLTRQAETLGFSVRPSTMMAPGADTLKQVVEGGLETLPGGAMVLGRAMQNDRALLDTLAARAIGETAEAPTDEVLQAARTRIGGEYNRLFTRGTEFTFDPAAVSQQVDDVVNSTVRPFIRRGAEDPIEESINRMREVMATGRIDAHDLHVQQSQLNKQGQQAMRGANSNPDLGQGLLDLRSILLNVARQNLNGADQAAFDTARNQYRVLAALEDGQHLDPVNGSLSPGRFASYLQRRDKTGWTRGNTGRGNTPLDQLYTGTRYLARVQKQNPTSFTTERSWAGNTLKGLAAAAAAAGGAETAFDSGGATAGLGTLAAGLLAPNLAARALMAPGMRNWMVSPVGQVGRAMGAITDRVGAPTALAARPQPQVKPQAQVIGAAASAAMTAGAHDTARKLAVLARKAQRGDKNATTQAAELIREIRDRAAMTGQTGLVTVANLHLKRLQP